MDFRSLHEQISQQFTVAEELLRTVLFDDGKIAIQEGKEKASGEVLSPDSLVVAKTSLRLCQNKKGNCQQCDNLHLCKYFVCGDCTFQNKCKNSHDLTSAQNKEILRRFGFQDLTEQQLFQLLLQNDPYLLPEICHHYNKGDGEHGSCRFNTTCTKLHMCQHFLEGDCKFGSQCKRAHAIDAQGMKLFKQYSKDNITGLYKIYRNKLIIVNHKTRPAAVLPEVSCPTPVSPSKAPFQAPSKAPFNAPSKAPSRSPRSPTSPAPSKCVTDAERNEICLFFIRRSCSFNERCAHIHWHLPYRWQIWDGINMTWKDMENMEDIEKAYCDPANNTSCTDEPTTPAGIFRFLTLQTLVAPAVQSVDFIKMTYDASPVRRLSTASSVLKPPHFILTTEWTWYWKDDSGIWVEYGQGGAKDTPASFTSKTLENIYLADRDAEIEFTAGQQKYKLHFKGAQGMQMYQQNLKFQTIREVRRRPRFMSAHDVEEKLRSPPSNSSSSSTVETVPVPSNWDKDNLPEFGYKLVRLSTSTNEFRTVDKLFKKTMPQNTISSIKRIQNPSLWKVFQWQKDQMKKRNDGKPVTEKHLFHGTDKSLVDAICDQNFDWRMCGVHGTAYGKGSYFARDASYSNNYATGRERKVMFVALVLVGEYTKGQSHYVRPPPKRNGRTFYDSCVNDERDPGIFVIFEKQQIYPEYVIKYS